MTGDRPGGPAVFFPGLVPAGYSTLADFIHHTPQGRRRFAEASGILGYDLADAYRDADINDSEVFQHACLAVYLALTDWAVERDGLRAMVCSGQSFGGLAAATFAGAITLPDTFDLIHRSTRWEVEYFAGLPEPVGCYFFGRVGPDDVTRLIDRYTAAGHWVELSVEFDNGIFAVSATMATIERLKGEIARLGGYSFHTLTRAEHCAGVAPLRARVAVEYDKVDWRAARTPIVSDIDGSLLYDGAVIKEHLLDGWVVPARWRTIVDGMRTAGADRVYVVGPRTMFGRVTKNAFATVALSPKLVLADQGNSDRTQVGVGKAD